MKLSIRQQFKMKKVCYAFFLLLSVYSFGQEMVVSGIISDKKYGQPIPAIITTITRDKKVQADFNGKYAIRIALSDTLLFEFIGYKTQKIKVTAELLNVALTEDRYVETADEPHYYPKISVTKKDIKNANNAKYNFKMYAKKNVFVIYVSELSYDYDLSKEDLEFEQKYKVKYSIIANYKIDYLTKYNKLTFKHLKKKYKKSWIAEIRKDAVGLEKE